MLLDRTNLVYSKVALPVSTDKYAMEKVGNMFKYLEEATEEMEITDERVEEEQAVVPVAPNENYQQVQAKVVTLHVELKVQS